MRRFIVLFAVLAVFAAACSGGGVVGSVNGDEILVSEVSELLTGDDDGAVGGQEFASALFNVIVDRVFVAASTDQFGITVDQAAVDQEREAAVQQLTAAGQTLEDALATQGITEELLDASVSRNVLIGQIQDALAADAVAPTEEELMAAYEQQLETVSNVCASHILLETEEDAQDALDRALGGEDFAGLAVELSTGPSGPDGGDLGCASPANYVPEFATATMEAEVGTATGPVETEFGFHVILVTERTSPTFEEARADIEAGLTGAGSQERFFNWAIAELSGADVQIDEQYGTWTTEPQPTVLPPGS